MTKKDIIRKCISIVPDMYRAVKKNVRTCHNWTAKGFTLSSFVFATFLDELTGSFVDVPCCMFVEDFFSVRYFMWLNANFA